MKTKSILIFGAGKIGRSFIGQLFNEAAYKVIFVDIDQNIVNKINKHKEYKIIIKDEIEKLIHVRDVRAVYALDHSTVSDEIMHASIIAISVGKNSLIKVVPTLGDGLLKRFQLNKNLTLDIILAENMRSSEDFMRNQLSNYLPDNYPLDQLVGFVETSIGKMVPLLTPDDLINDPLQVFAEPYNELILDKRGFKGEIPKVANLSPKENIKAWVDRKAFLHNMAHTAVSFLGYFDHPLHLYIHEVLENKKIYSFTRKAMLQAAGILLEYYPKDFNDKELEKHIDELLIRFQNSALMDTVFRVGQDLPRKLNADDRFGAIIQMARKKRLPYNLIMESMAYGFFFESTGEDGNRNESDVLFLDSLNIGFENALELFCGYSRIDDKHLIEELKEQYIKLKNIKKKKLTQV